MSEEPFSYCRDPNRIEGDYQHRMTSGLIELCEFLKANLSGGLNVMCEVGSAFGESAEIFARYFKVVHCVDNWSSPHNGLPDPEVSFDIRAKRLGNLIKHRQSSRLAAAIWHLPLDFCYIDANHDYEHVVEDIAAWFSKVGPHGFIGGHDYGAPTCPGVKKAVDEFFGKPDATFPDFSWAVRL